MATEAANKLVIIGGGSGFIGTHLRKTLTSKGYDVKIISRTNTKSLPSVITWDQVKSSGLPECRAIIGLQGQNIMDMGRRWTDDFKRDLWESRIQTTALLRQIVDDTRCTSTFVSTSAVSMYPPNPASAFEGSTENDEVVRPFSEVGDRSSGTNEKPAYTCDADFLVNMCRAWEKAAFPTNTKASEISPYPDVKTTIIRTGLVLGRSGGFIKSAYLPFSLGLGSRIGSGTQLFPWIHIADLTGIYVAAMEQGVEHRETNNGIAIYNGVAPEPCTNIEFVKAFTSALHRPALGLPLPPFILKALMGPVRASMLLDSLKVLPKATLEQLHYHYLYPDIRSACEALVKNPSE